MIVYDQRGYALLFHVCGSVLISTLPHALVAAGMNYGLWKGLHMLDFDYVCVHLLPQCCHDLLHLVTCALRCCVTVVRRSRMPPSTRPSR